MNPDDIKKMQEVASRNTQEHHLKFMEENKEKIDAEMQKIKQEAIRQEQFALEELSEEERENAFMVLS